MQKSELVQTTNKEGEGSFDSQLAEKLDIMSYYSTGETVEIKIVSVDYDGEENVTVEFEPPVGDRFTRQWRIPYFQK